MSDQVHYHRGVNRSETLVFEEPCGPHDLIPETLIPKGNKSRVSGDGLESIRPATNFPGISVDSNQVNRLVEKSILIGRPTSLRLSPLRKALSREFFHQQDGLIAFRARGVGEQVGHVRE